MGVQCIFLFLTLKTTMLTESWFLQLVKKILRSQWMVKVVLVTLLLLKNNINMTLLFGNDQKKGNLLGKAPGEWEGLVGTLSAVQWPVQCLEMKWTYTQGELTSSFLITTTS